jgi:hypothetical protein
MYRNEINIPGNVFLTRYKLMPDFPAYYTVDDAWLALLYALLVYLTCTVHVFAQTTNFIPRQ